MKKKIKKLEKKPELKLSDVLKKLMKNNYPTGNTYSLMYMMN